MPSAELRDLAGEYRFNNRSIAISLKNDRLWLGLPDTPDKPLFAISKSRCFVRTTETEFQFERDPSGNIVSPSSSTPMATKLNARALDLTTRNPHPHFSRSGVSLTWESTN